jgi:hypothetical protein
MGTLGGFPNPPAMSFGEQSSPPLTRSMGTGSACSTADVSIDGETESVTIGEQSSPPLTRSMGTGSGCGTAEVSIDGETESVTMDRCAAI